MLTLPPVIKNLLIINVLLLIATIMLDGTGIDVDRFLALFNPRSVNFEPYQIVSYMFMHANFFHLLVNMFALWMFGRALEQIWGSKKFLIFYMVTGIGAGVIHLIVNEFRFQSVVDMVPPEMYETIKYEGYDVIRKGMNYIDPVFGQANALLNTPMVGASGSVFGILLAFGMLFPNAELMMIPIPIPIKAKYFVVGYGLFELYSGFANNPTDNVAHFAHLGGMLFGYILIRYWRKSGKMYL